MSFSLLQVVADDRPFLFFSQIPLRSCNCSGCQHRRPKSSWCWLPSVCVADVCGSQPSVRWTSSRTGLRCLDADSFRLPKARAKSESYPDSKSLDLGLTDCPLFLFSDSCSLEERCQQIEGGEGRVAGVSWLKLISHSFLVSDTLNFCFS